jgi:hypothetical protein
VREARSISRSNSRERNYANIASIVDNNPIQQNASNISEGLRIRVDEPGIHRLLDSPNQDGNG